MKINISQNLIYKKYSHPISTFATTNEYSLSQHVPSTFETSISPPIDSAFFPFSRNHPIQSEPNVKTCQLRQLNQVGRTEQQSSTQITSYNNYIESCF